MIPRKDLVAGMKVSRRQYKHFKPQAMIVLSVEPYYDRAWFWGRPTPCDSGNGILVCFDGYPDWPFVVDLRYIIPFEEAQAQYEDLLKSFAGTDKVTHED